MTIPEIDHPAFVAGYRSQRKTYILTYCTGKYKSFIVICMISQQLKSARCLCKNSRFETEKFCKSVYESYRA